MAKRCLLMLLHYDGQAGRLDRWESRKDFNLGVISTNRVLQTNPADVNHRDTAKTVTEPKTKDTSSRASQKLSGTSDLWMRKILTIWTRRCWVWLVKLEMRTRR